ncbi:MAG: PSP1 domain-containing protein [Luteibaculaceae bacterium]
MGCATCSNNKTADGLPAGCKNNGSCKTGGCDKLAVFDWLTDLELPSGQNPFDVVEVRFKGTRKGFFRNLSNLQLCIGNVVAVQSATGYDVGVVSMVGELVKIQYQKKGNNEPLHDLKKVIRLANQEDIDLWHEARGLENETMHRSRTIAAALGLNMKISDVEYQGDKTKATFFYTADDRVDFRELIRKLADAFKVRIEMRQIGARQEAGRLGGIGSCGRELCCSTWLTDFRSVSTAAARYQQLSLNPQKLAGQCGKLKCCLNYELDMYLDAVKDFPDNNIKLKTKKGTAEHFKTDIFKKVLWYNLISNDVATPVPIPVERVKEIIALNNKGVYPEDLKNFMAEPLTSEVDELPDYENVVGQDELTRFDHLNKGKKRPQKNQTRGRRNIQNQNNKPVEAKDQAANTPKKQSESTAPRAENEGSQKRNPRRNQRKNRNNDKSKPTE